jgi:hypothetical protein
MTTTAPLHCIARRFAVAVAIVATTALAPASALAKPVADIPVPKPHVVIDARSPDVKDATAPEAALSPALAQEQYYSSYTHPNPIGHAVPQAPVSGGSQFDWPSAGVGAGAAVGIALLLVFAGLTLSTRRRRSALLS